MDPHRYCDEKHIMKWVLESMANIANKSLYLAARDYEKRWGCAPLFPEQENRIYLAWEMPKAKPARWMNSMAN